MSHGDAMYSIGNIVSNTVIIVYGDGNWTYTVIIL